MRLMFGTWRLYYELMVAGISSVYMRKNRGSSVEPYGTPYFIMPQ
jgi:hypothetical protein